MQKFQLYQSYSYLIWDRTHLVRRDHAELSMWLSRNVGSEYVELNSKIFSSTGSNVVISKYKIFPSLTQKRGHTES